MVEQYINSVMAELNGKIPDMYLERVRKTMEIAIDGYDIVKQEKSLIPYSSVLPECYKAYIVTKKIEGRSDKTLAIYKLYLEDFFNTVQTPIDKITSNMVKVYLYQIQQNRSISNRTLDTRRSVLSSFFAWSAAEGYIDKNPMATIKPIKYECMECQPLDDMELERVRESCADIREQAMVEFLYSTGCRVTEMERVNRSDVNFDTMTVMLFGKGNKHRKAYLTAKSVILLQQYLKTRNDDNDALFVYSRNPHKRLKKGGIEKIIGQIGDRAGIDRLHPHLIRHTTATNCLQHGMDVTQVQQLLGHVNVNTTMIYAKVDSSDVQRNHRKYLA